MKPDRSNYEIWIIDWVDGKLDQDDTDMLMSFLDANPDLKEEAESFSVSRLDKVHCAFPAKEDLKKTVSDLQLSQIEFLSVAYLENDITREQMSDLKESFNLNEENRKAFDNIQKIKLIPPEITYKNKNLLKKQPTGAKVIRLVSIGLSAAATVAILITTYMSLQHYYSQKNSESEQIVISEYTGMPFEVSTRRFKAPPEEPESREVLTASADKTDNQVPVMSVEEKFSEITRQAADEIPAVPVFLIPKVNTEITGQFLASTNNIDTYESFDGERSRISRFIARNFREKILKEPVVSETPLKSYEIAEAGIDGLNKLLGWNMAFVRISDEEGELKSIYFSSRMLKFNAPVKKTESQP